MGSPVSFGFSGTTDALGNASVYIRGFSPGMFAVWNMQAQIPGNAPNMTVLQGGSMVGNAPVVAGTGNVGPITTAPGVPTQLIVAGALPSTPFNGQVLGAESADPLDADLAAVIGSTSAAVNAVNPWDGATIINETGVSHSGQNNYPQTAGGVALANQTFAVQLFASVLLGVRMNSGNPVLLTFRWYAEPTGSRLVGQRSMMVDSVVGTLVATIPNLGPYLQVFSSTPLGGVWNWNLSLMGSNRLVPDIFGGNFTPYLVEQYAQTANASQTTDYPFGTVYGGPIHLAFTNNASSPGQITARLMTMGTDGTYHSGFAFSDVVQPSVTGQDSQIIAPPVPCAVRVITAGTAGTYTYSVLVYSSATAST